MSSEKISDLQKLSVITFLGANRLLKDSVELNDTVGIQLATDQIDIVHKLLGKEIFEAVVNQLEGDENSEARNIIDQSREFVDLFRDEDE
jgi:hypothetical protein